MPTIILDKFGGYSADSSPEGNDPMRAQSLKNVEISDSYREVKGSSGSQKIKDTAVVASQPVDGLYDFRKKADATHEPLIFIDGRFFKWDGSNFTELKDTGDTAMSRTPDKVMRAVTLLGRVYCVADGNNPWWYDGTNWFEWGIPAPANLASGKPSAAVAAQGGTNMDLGWHELFFTFENGTSLEESGPSTIMRVNVIVLANDKIVLSTGYSTAGAGGSTIVPTGVTHFNVWVSLANDPCSFYLAGNSIAFDDTSGGTNYDIIASDITLAAADAFSDFAGPPPKPFGIMVFGPEFSRIGLFGSTEYPSRLWWTNTDEPFKFDEANFQDFGSDDGDRIQACAQLSSGVIILKRHTTWGMYGASSATFHTAQQSDNIGCMGRYSLVVHQGKGYWLSERGCYVSDGIGEPRAIGEGKVRKFIEGLNWATKSDFIRGGRVQETDQIWWTVPNGTTQATPNKVLVLDLRTQEFLLRDFGAATEDNIYAIAGQVADSQESTLFGHGTGFITKFVADEFDWWTDNSGANGDPQVMEWESHWMETGGRVTEFEVVHDKQTAGNLTVTVTGADSEDDLNPITATATVLMTSPKTYRHTAKMQKRLVKVKLANSTTNQTFGVRKVILHTAALGGRRLGR